MANGDTFGTRDSDQHVTSVPEAEAAQRIREETRTEIRSLIRHELTVGLMKPDRVTELTMSPETTALAVADLESIQRYTLYALGVVGFFVWILLMSRRY